MKKALRSLPWVVLFTLIGVTWGILPDVNGSRVSEIVDAVVYGVIGALFGLFISAVVASRRLGGTGEGAAED